jgi:hypothetical protein
MRIVVLEESTTFETRQDIFNRVNTGGDAARPAEIRRGALQGAFMTFVENCATDPLFHILCPMSDSLKARREPSELVLRFFAYSDTYKLFKHDVAEFLNEYAKQHKNRFDEDRLRSEYVRMLAFVQRHFPAGFAKSTSARSTPRVRFEAISVGVNLALREMPQLVPANMDWIHLDEFAAQVTTHASNSGPRLRSRVEFVRDQLLGRR